MPVPFDVENPVTIQQYLNDQMTYIAYMKAYHNSSAHASRPALIYVPFFKAIRLSITRPSGHLGVVYLPAMLGASVMGLGLLLVSWWILGILFSLAGLLLVGFYVYLYVMSIGNVQRKAIAGDTGLAAFISESPLLYATKTDMSCRPERSLKVLKISDDLTDVVHSV